MAAKFINFALVIITHLTLSSDSLSIGPCFCSGCSASHRKNHQKFAEWFWQRRKFSTKGYNYTLYLRYSQLSEIKLQS